MDRNGNILIVVTNVDQYESVGFRTGLWLGELTHFWDAVQERDFKASLPARPEGGCRSTRRA